MDVVFTPKNNGFVLGMAQQPRMKQDWFAEFCERSSYGFDIYGHKRPIVDPATPSPNQDSLTSGLFHPLI